MNLKGEKSVNRFEKSLKRIKKNVEPADCWTEEDWEHYRTIITALEFCSKFEEVGEDDANS